ncbi:Pre-rRNA-processing protein HuESF2 [Hanseniaspora uvarum DSM 2768]|jgi:ESF2/ABP1 family protein|nr:hypothetical protein FOG48_03356 [Hanseniaspora uvarum]KAF0278352.1 hypothetical protein FOG50_00789 [Hanseniaspora uvarum]KKA03042.1 Pre-rRNA-processing protein HuESF2 [Hanseniaspora uvarum DSM 2768]
MSNIDDFSSSDDEENNLLLLNKSKKVINTAQDSDSDDNKEVLDPISEQQVYVPSKETTAEDKLKKLEKLKVYKNKKKSKYKPGVVYISKLPPYMKPQKLRQVLQKFGEIDRIYMKKESEQNRKNRLKQGGNKKDKYEEGWVEFIRKSDAKLCCSTLNGNILGGKKNSFYYDDVMNMKYLSGFKWTDLTEQMAKESEQRQSKLELEINNANKLNELYIKNVEKSKMVNNIQKNGKRSRDDDNDYVISQRKTYTKRFKDQKAIKEDKSNDLNSVLGSI